MKMLVEAQESRMKMRRADWHDTVVQAQALAQDGQTIEAIKLLRRRTDCGLKEAVDAVRRLQKLPMIAARKPNDK